MELFVDDYFQIGSAHIRQGKPCQDYTRTMLHSDAAFAALSDGCSSGGETDVGARLVVLNALRSLQDYKQVISGLDGVQRDSKSDVLADVIAGLSLSRSMFNIQNHDLLATLMYATVCGNHAVVEVLGDGVVAVKLRDGTLTLKKYDWNRNMPFYPIYRNTNLDGFIKAQGGDVVAKVLNESVVHIDSDGITVDKTEEWRSLEEGVQGISQNMSATDVEYIALFSDGITQIDGMNWEEATRQCLNFKNMNGSFLKRRAIRFLKDAQKEGKGAIDDFSVAIIRIEHGEE